MDKGVLTAATDPQSNKGVTLLVFLMCYKMRRNGVLISKLIRGIYLKFQLNKVKVIRSSRKKKNATDNINEIHNLYAKNNEQKGLNSATTNNSDKLSGPG